MEDGRNPTPFTITVLLALCAVRADGEVERTCGWGFWTIRETELELPPPGFGLTTENWLAPAVFTSVALSGSSSWVLPIYLGIRFSPFQTIKEEGTKPIPVMVNTRLESFRFKEDGDTEEIAGTGSSMISGKGEEAPPPGEGLNTVMWALPAAAKSPVERINSNCVLLM